MVFPGMLFWNIFVEIENYPLFEKNFAKICSDTHYDALMKRLIDAITHFYKQVLELFHKELDSDKPISKFSVQIPRQFTRTCGSYNEQGVMLPIRKPTHRAFETKPNIFGIVHIFFNFYRGLIGLYSEPIAARRLFYMCNSNFDMGEKPTNKNHDTLIQKCLDILECHPSHHPLIYNFNSRNTNTERLGAVRIMTSPSNWFSFAHDNPMPIHGVDVYTKIEIDETVRHILICESNAGQTMVVWCISKKK